MGGSEPSMVTVPTLDHGDVTTAEPDWCLGHVDARPEFRCDTGHVEAAHEANYCGHELAYAALVQDPFAERGGRDVGVVVEMGSLPHRLGPTELRELANVLVDFAETLNGLAGRLITLRVEREGADSERGTQATDS